MPNSAPGPQVIDAVGSVAVVLVVTARQAVEPIYAGVGVSGHRSDLVRLLGPSAATTSSASVTCSRPVSTHRTSASSSAVPGDTSTTSAPVLRTSPGSAD